MGLIHEHASDDLVETVLGLGLLAAVVGAGVVDVNGLSVPPPVPLAPGTVAAVILEANWLGPIFRPLETAAVFDAMVPLIIAEVGRAADGAAAALFVQKPRLPALLISAA